MPQHVETSVNREKYLNIEKYQNLHNFIMDVIKKTDDVCTLFLKEKLYDKFLIKKVILNAPEVASSALYSLTYIFFEEKEEISFRENDVTMSLHCYLHSNEQFEIKGALGSIYEEIDFFYPPTSSLSDDEKKMLLQLPDQFTRLLNSFFEKELNYRKK